MKDKCPKCKNVEESYEVEDGYFLFECEVCGYYWDKYDDREPPDPDYPDYEMDNFKEDIRDKAEDKALDRMADNLLEGRR